MKTRILLSYLLLTLCFAWGCSDDVVDMSLYSKNEQTQQKEPDNHGQQQQQQDEVFGTAADAVIAMGAGWNLGNTLDSNSGDTGHMWIEAYSNRTPKDYETAWGQPQATRELMRMFKNAGFGAIRIPVTWYPHMGTITLHDTEKWDMSTGWQGTDVDPVWMARVKEVVDYVLDEGMYCILNVHHDTGDASTAWLRAGEDGYEAAKERYQALWKQIAEQFRDYGPRLLFESYNEMLDKYGSWCFASFASPNKYDAAEATSAYNGINSYAQLFVNTVRRTGGNNEKRNLVVNTYGACSGDGTWNTHLQDPLKYMALPSDTEPGHIAVQIHSYWSSSQFSSSMKKEIDKLHSNLKKYIVDRLGVPVIIGEWGGDSGEDSTLDVQFAEYFSSKAKENGVAAFMWMGLTDGKDRANLTWTMPKTKDAILSAYLQ